MTLKEFCGLLRKTSTYFVKSWELQSNGAIRLITRENVECCPIQAVALMRNPHINATHSNATTCTYRALFRKLELNAVQISNIIRAADNDLQTPEHSELRKELLNAVGLQES